MGGEPQARQRRVRRAGPESRVEGLEEGDRLAGQRADESGMILGGQIAGGEALEFGQRVGVRAARCLVAGQRTEGGEDRIVVVRCFTRWPARGRGSVRCVAHGGRLRFCSGLRASDVDSDVDVAASVEISAASRRTVRPRRERQA